MGTASHATTVPELGTAEAAAVDSTGSPDAAPVAEEAVELISDEYVTEVVGEEECAAIADAVPASTQPNEVSASGRVRDRRPTVVSGIPAKLAETMHEVADDVPVAARDDAAPEPVTHDETRRIGDADRDDILDECGPGYVVEIIEGETSARRKRVADLVDRARACLEAGDVAAAAAAAERALTEDEAMAPPGLVEIIEPARPLFERVFTAFIGSPDGIPVLDATPEQLQALALPERGRQVLDRLDGTCSLFAAVRGPGLVPADALRVMAKLAQAGLLTVRVAA